MAQQLNARVYSEYFAHAIQRVVEYRARAIQCAVGFGLLVAICLGVILGRRLVGETISWELVLLVLLVLLVVLIGVYGVSIAVRAKRKLRVALDALLETATFLEKQPTRDEFVDFVLQNVKPDECNVPEALAALVYSENPSGDAHLAAPRVVAPAASTLSVLSATRTILVLSGLLGTVFFASRALGGSETTAGGPNIWLLSAAMLSTLTGVLGALVTGYVLGRFENLLDEIEWETDSFFSSVVTPALRLRPEDRPIQDEIALWEGVRAAIGAMTTEVRQSFDRMAGNAEQFSNALLGLEERLRNLPQLTVPPALDKLVGSVGAFHESVSRLEAIIPPLIEATAKMELIVPRKVLEDVGALRKEVRDEAGRLKQTAQELTAEARTLVSETRELGDSLVEVRDEVHGLVSKLPADLEDQLETLASETRDLTAVMTPLPSQISEGFEGVKTETNTLQGTARALTETTRRLSVQTDALSGGLDSARKSFEGQVPNIVAVQAWLKSIMTSPVLRFLLFGFSRPEEPADRA